ncbi:MAG: MATE family efflux transporter [Ruminococcaceae bacterium]|nr:MATE family efflux transporter [Oscillospiraceae bacterium]
MNKNFTEKSKWTTIGIILSLAWPTILEQVMQTAVQYIDTAMVGSLGTYATAAVGATTTLGWLVNSTTTALGIGFLSYIAKACGAGDRESAKKTTAQSVLVTLISGVLFTIILLSVSPYIPTLMQVDPNIRIITSQYFFILYMPMLPRAATAIFGTVLRAAGDTKTPMKVGALVNVINVVLNFFLIYETRTVKCFSALVTIPGAGFGVIGAATASAIAFFVGGILITVALWNHKMVSPKGYSLKPDKTILKPCLRIALPNMLQRFATTLGYVAFAAMINSLGEVSTAAHTVANTVESAFYIPGYGMQAAAATLTGNAYGAKDNKRMKSIANMFLPIEIILMTLSGAALFFMAPWLVSLFADNKEVMTLGITVLRMVAVSEPFYGLPIVIEGMMQGVGKTRQPFVYNVIGMWGIRIIGTFICINLLGLDLISAWACMIAHNLLLFVMYLITFVRGKWNPLNRKEN